MNPHFFTAPFYFAFIWFRVQVAASPPYFRRWYSRIAAFPSRAMLLSLAAERSWLPIGGAARRAEGAT